MTGDAAPTPNEGEQPLQDAAYWFVRHESGGELTTAEMQAWDAWICDERNNAEYEQLYRTQWQLRALPRPSLPTDQELQADRDEPPGDASDVPRSQTDPDELGPRQDNARKIVAGAINAGIALFVVIAIYLSLYPGSLALGPDQKYSTAVGDQRDYVLEDGSVVTLAAASSLTVSFSATRRTAVLNQGEARFRVKHERRRPFIVLADSGSITAVGTVFDVRRYSNRVLVTVSEGAVEVAPRESHAQNTHLDSAVVEETTSWTPLRVANGEEMTYNSSGEATAPRPTDAKIAQDWAQGMLVYRRRPLREVIEDLKRYSSRHILLDSAAAELPYTGTLLTSDLDPWLRGLPNVSPVEVVDSQSDAILIRAKPPKK
jgi:transmembrane sensor